MAAESPFAWLLLGLMADKICFLSLKAEEKDPIDVVSDANDVKMELVPVDAASGISGPMNNAQFTAEVSFRLEHVLVQGVELLEPNVPSRK